MQALPTPETPVLAWDGNQWVRAIRIPKHTKEQHGDWSGDFADYDEATDNYYWPEGWYEIQSHGGDEPYWFIHPQPTVWVPLPPKPADSEGVVL